MPPPASLPPCPSCSAPSPRWLEFTSTINKVPSFQCLACGHLWVVEPLTPASDAKI
jgi:transposase-like protein